MQKIKVLTKDEIAASLKGVAKVGDIDLTSDTSVDNVEVKTAERNGKARRKRCRHCRQLQYLNGFTKHETTCGANPNRKENRTELCEKCGVKYAPQTLSRHIPKCSGDTFEESMNTIIDEYRKVNKARALRDGKSYKRVHGNRFGTGYMNLLNNGTLDVYVNRLRRNNVIPEDWRGQNYETMPLPMPSEEEMAQVEDAKAVETQPEPQIAVLTITPGDGDFDAFVSIMEDHISNSDVTFREFEAWRHVTKVIWEKA